MAEDRPVTAEELRALTKKAREVGIEEAVANALRYLESDSRDFANVGAYSYMICRLHTDDRVSADAVMAKLSEKLAPRGLRVFIREEGPSQQSGCQELGYEAVTCFNIFASWELPGA